jgi:tripartite-type tricarboxylate transporter receptor subunit TctC
MRWALLPLACAALAAALLPAQAQDYPAKPITLVMPYAPGGGTDHTARMLSQKLEQRLGQPLIPDYKPGAASVIAATHAARMPADGYTILYATSTTMAINVSVHKKLGYDPVRDFIPVSLFGITPFVLVMHPSVPANSVEELAALAKSGKTSGKTLTYASNGAGGASHLFAELMKTQLGIDMTHVPYKGNAPALNDVTGGHVSLMFVDPTAAVQLVRDGKLKTLGVTSAGRIPMAPEIPPLAENGLPGFDVASWHMFVAPAATPRAIVDRLNTTLRDIVRSSDVAADFNRRGVVPHDGGPPDELVVFVQEEIVRWGKVVRAAGVAGVQ